MRLNPISASLSHQSRAIKRAEDRRAGLLNPPKKTGRVDVLRPHFFKSPPNPLRLTRGPWRAKAGRGGAAVTHTASLKPQTQTAQPQSLKPTLLPHFTVTHGLTITEPAADSVAFPVGGFLSCSPFVSHHSHSHSVARAALNSEPAIITLAPVLFKVTLTVSPPIPSFLSKCMHPFQSPLLLFR
ncbi:hypothetical protein PIB30_037385 [Stylosanthes scabra]|uniref:Uncharacterized protein n=1 Tax=Stylosanthes scabra TaxID=79078 RepID=A0ABU6WC03_9FABA|nr:hypothetical protein [Stylosanthes scabra]